MIPRVMRPSTGLSRRRYYPRRRRRKKAQSSAAELGHESYEASWEDRGSREEGWSNFHWIWLDCGLNYSWNLILGEIQLPLSTDSKAFSTLTHSDVCRIYNSNLKLYDFSAQKEPVPRDILGKSGEKWRWHNNNIAPLLFMSAGTINFLHPVTHYDDNPEITSRLPKENQNWYRQAPFNAAIISFDKL